MGNKRCCVYDEDLLFHKEVYLIQILIRLPVVSLLRFKSVCKSWRSFIESPYFIDLHTATTFNSSSSSSSSSSKFGSFILHSSVIRDEPDMGCRRLFDNAVLMLSSVSDESECLSRSGSGSGSWWWRKLNSSWPPLKNQLIDDVDSDSDDQMFKVEDDNDQLVLKLDNLGFPPCYELGDNFPNDIVGSCNGLVCLYHQEHNQFSLWNPATRQYRNLPKTISSPFFSCCLAGFCFDAETKDYKVVLLNGLGRESYYGKWRPYIPLECLCRVQVYSLSTDSWRLLEGITCLPGYPFSIKLNQGKLLYLNGCFFFMALFLNSTHQKCFPDNDKFMISFHLNKEIITPIQLPDHHRKDKLYLRYLGDKIALFTAPHVYDNDAEIYTYQDFKAETYYEDSDDEEGLEDDIDTDYTNYVVGDTRICNDEGLEDEIDTDHTNYAVGDTGICKDESLKAEIDTDHTNYEDGDTGISNDEGLKSEICSDDDSFHRGNSISTDEMEYYGYEDFNIWVLNEHGTSTSSMNKEYWKKLHSFRIEHERLGDWNLPRGISNDGKFALLETKYNNGVGKKIKLYNLHDKEVKNNFLSCSELESNATAYKPSLVSIIGGNGAGAAATDLKLESTVTMDDMLPYISRQHFPMTAAAVAQCMHN